MSEHPHFIPGLRPPAQRKSTRSRELDFFSSARTAPLPEYKPMFDVHLKHLWVNPRVRTTLQSAGFLDESGSPVDVDIHRRKLYVVEQELAQADSVERGRAMDKERKLRERQTVAKRQEVHEKHLRQVSLMRDERRRRREASAMSSTSRSLPPVGASGSRSTSSLPALSGSPH
mmetsp:Transcript_54761/g.123315  ORF Transcript_54761/g.123315 Transcript_54761/m.123315 type:complete len:173 (+) Transcript_54761:85-603(+)|eukprot:CAMPEP_0197928314 /NCGR_PEP_ID=MMETSP1439-20131203/102109_1 /TAXON_ID=66791 /ORGANISM="Gonyaulax spinifera, Strain CCMP409" /LENGTH=172 /DNA_ID=CAMNT_0043550913 /DNA_START=85 /DNA_END=603 /DNA_ORIENTATION=-